MSLRLHVLPCSCGLQEEHHLFVKFRLYGSLFFSMLSNAVRGIFVIAMIEVVSDKNLFVAGSDAGNDKSPLDIVPTTDLIHNF